MLLPIRTAGRALLIYAFVYGIAAYALDGCTLDLVLASIGSKNFTETARLLDGIKSKMVTNEVWQVTRALAEHFGVSQDDLARGRVDGNRVHGMSFDNETFYLSYPAEADGVVGRLRGAKMELNSARANIRGSLSIPGHLLNYVASNVVYALKKAGLSEEDALHIAYSQEATQSLFLSAHELKGSAICGAPSDRRSAQKFAAWLKHEREMSTAGGAKSIYDKRTDTYAGRTEGELFSLFSRIANSDPMNFISQQQDELFLNLFFHNDNLNRLYDFFAHNPMFFPYVYHSFLKPNDSASRAIRTTWLHTLVQRDGLTPKDANRFLDSFHDLLRTNLSTLTNIRSFNHAWDISFKGTEFSNMN
jgi:hypothetical protein